MKTNNRHFFSDIPLLSLGVLLFLLLVLSTYFGWTEALDEALYDQQQRLLPRQYNPDVVIVEIDDQSLSLIGSWPWDRAIHAELISELSSAKVVAFNVLLEDNRLSTQSDRLLKNAMIEHGRVVLPVYLEQSLINATERMVMPDDDLVDAAAQGHVNSYQDDDGILRRVRLYDHAAQHAWPHFSLATAQHALLPSKLPVATSGEWLIPFAAPRFDTYSYVDVLTQQVSAEAFRDKVVFVGMAAAAIGDPLLVSGASDGMQTPAVYINAAVFNAISQGNWVEVLPAILIYGLSVLLLVSGLMSVPRLSGVNQVVVTVILLSVCMLISQLALLLDFHFPVATPLIVLLLIPFFWNLLRLSRLYRYLHVEINRLNEQQATQRFMVPLDDGVESIEAGDLFSRQLAILKRVRRATDQSQALFESSIDSIASGILVSSLQGDILFRNKIVDLLFSDKTSRIFELLAMIDLHSNKSWQEIRLQVEGDFTQAVYEGRLGERELAISLRRLPDSKLSEPLLVINLADITEIKRAQQSRLETIDFLSHDLRSPIASIRALIQYAKTDLSGVNVEELLNKIDRYSERSLYFAEQFLQLARVESAPDVVLYETDMYSVCQDAIDSLYHQAQLKSQVINLNCEVESWALVNGELMERIILNLVSNAIKYSPEKSPIEVNIKNRSTEAQQDWLRVSVVDRGEGIPETLRGRLFDSFQKGEGDEAIGLGLRFVDVALRRHGSQIQVDSSSQGSVFYFDVKKI